MIWRGVEIEGSWDTARTPSNGVERTRLVMASATSNYTLTFLLVVVADSNDKHAANAYSSALRTSAT